MTANMKKKKVLLSGCRPTVVHGVEVEHVSALPPGRGWHNLVPPHLCRLRSLGHGGQGLFRVLSALTPDHTQTADISTDAKGG